MAAGRPKKYTKKKLREETERYFRSISRTILARDNTGGIIRNDDGDEIQILQYVVPPSIAGLCLQLGIDRSTWQNYADPALHPELADVAAEARARIEAYLEQELLTREKGLQGMIYLASVEGQAPALLSEWIAGFHEKYPHVTYSMWNGKSDDVVNRVMKGLCELAVILEPHNAEGVESVPVYQEPWVAMIPEGHPLALEQKETIRMEELLPYELIIPSRESRLQEINGWFGEGEKPIVRCRIAHMLNAYELTKRGVGLTIYPAAAADLAEHSGICIRKITEPKVMASYVLIRNRSRALSRVAQEFFNYVEERTAANLVQK